MPLLPPHELFESTVRLNAGICHSFDSDGTAALRQYTSFIYPKNNAALAEAERPQRAIAIARNISFVLREHRAERQTWLRKVDRAHMEVAHLPHHPLILVLDNVRSAANCGNMFRAAEAARLQHVYCCGITPTPPQPGLLKTAVGAAEYVSYSHEGSTAELVRRLKAGGVTVWGVETTERSRSYTVLDTWPQPLAIVLGNELIGCGIEVKPTTKPQSVSSQEAPLCDFRS